MAIEQSHGKPRPTLPRSGDLQVVDSAESPTAGRTDGGRFAKGNGHSRENRARHHVRRLLGPTATDTAIAEIQSASMSLYRALIRSMPSQSTQVRTLVALQARHVALAAYWGEYAVKVGLDTESGIAALERASKDGQRAERLAVTALDIAKRLPKSEEADDWVSEMCPKPKGNGKWK